MIHLSTGEPARIWPPAVHDGGHEGRLVFLKAFICEGSLFEEAGPIYTRETVLDSSFLIK